MEFIELTRDEFSAYASKHEMANFYQSVEMEPVSDLTNWKSYYVGIRENGELIGASRLIAWTNRLNETYFHAVRGPLLDYHNSEVLRFFTESMKKFVREHHGYVFKIDPAIIYKERDIDGNVVEGGIDNSALVDELISLGYKHKGFNDTFDLSGQGRWVFILNLEGKTEKEVFMNFKPNHRRLINKTERYGIEIRELGYDELDVYKKITESTGDRRHFHDRDLSYYQLMYRQFVEKGEGKYLVAYLHTEKYLADLTKDLRKVEKSYEESLAEDPESNKTKGFVKQIRSLKERMEDAEGLVAQGPLYPLAAALFIIYAGEVSYLFSGSDDRYMNLFAQYAIQAYMIKDAVKLGCKTYNFFGITGNFDRHSADYGIYEFKKGFDGTCVEYIGEFEYPVTSFYSLDKLIHKIKK